MNMGIVPALDGDSNVAAGGIKRQVSWRDDAGFTRNRVDRWLYNGAGAATVVGRVYRILYVGDADTNPKAATCAAISGVYQEVAVAVEVIASAAWGWFAVEGYVMASVNGDSVDVAKGDFVKVVVATDDDAFVGNTTTRTANSHGIYSDDTSETDATPTNRLVYLIPWQAIIT